MLQRNVLKFVIDHSINLRMIGLIFGKSNFAQVKKQIDYEY